MQNIHTARLVLRPLVAADAVEVNRIANQASVLKWMPDMVSTVAETEGLLRFFAGQYAEIGGGDVERIALAVERDGVLVGVVSVGVKEEVGGEMEVAYFLDEAAAGHGYATEAVGAVAAWGLGALGVGYLIAIVETDNVASQRVVEKCGFEKVDMRMILNTGDTEEKAFYYYRFYG